MSNDTLAGQEPSSAQSLTISDRPGRTGKGVIDSLLSDPLCGEELRDPLQEEPGGAPGRPVTAHPFDAILFPQKRRRAAMTTTKQKAPLAQASGSQGQTSSPSQSSSLGRG